MCYIIRTPNSLEFWGGGCDNLPNGDSVPWKGSMYPGTYQSRIPGSRAPVKSCPLFVDTHGIGIVLAKRQGPDSSWATIMRQYVW